jgi:multidrug efflux pump subunit AcrB
MKRPEIMMAFTTFKADYPQYELQVDDIKAEQLGVSTKSILQTMQAYFGSAQASDFNRFGSTIVLWYKRMQKTVANQLPWTESLLKTDWRHGTYQYLGEIGTCLWP